MNNSFNYIPIYTTDGTKKRHCILQLQTKRRREGVLNIGSTEQTQNGGAFKRWVWL